MNILQRIFIKIEVTWRRVQPSLEQISFLLRALWFFFPAFLFLGLGLITFAYTEQGRDVVEQSLTLPLGQKTFIVIGLAFWVFTSWYTTRILAYNDNYFYAHAKKTITIIPRFLGYAVFIVLGIALCQVRFNPVHCWVYVLLSLLIFIVVLRIALHAGDMQLTKILSRRLAMRIHIFMTIIGLILIAVTWTAKSSWPLFSLIICQTGALCWVAFRAHSQDFAPDLNAVPQPFNLAELSQPGKRSFFQLVFWKKLEKAAQENQNVQAFIASERSVFFGYNCVATLAALAYLLIIVNVSIGRIAGSFAFVLLAFGILLGIGNFISFFSFRMRINLVFFMVLLLIFWGKLVEPHQVDTIDEPGYQNVYQERPDLKTYLQMWVNAPERKNVLARLDSFPIIFIQSDGGASRSGYWAASVLSRLCEEGDTLFRRHLLTLAGASGGSVGNTTFLAALQMRQDNPRLSTSTISQDFLSNDFLTFPLARMLGPDLINIGLWGDRAFALERSMEYPENHATEPIKTLSTLLRKDIGQFIPHTKHWVQPILCINTTSMTDAQPGVISNIDGKVFFPRIDVLGTMKPNSGLRVSTAMVLGSRFPYFSPAGYLNNKYYVDGGYFDNSGAGPILHLIAGIENLKDTLAAHGDVSFLAKAIKKFKYFVIHIQNTPIEKAKDKIKKVKVHPLLNDLAAPLITLSGSYGSQTDFNDFRLQSHLNSLGGLHRSVNLYQNENEVYPMNWALSDTAITTMNKRVRTASEIPSILQDIQARYTRKVSSVEKKRAER